MAGRGRWSRSLGAVRPGHWLVEARLLARPPGIPGGALSGRVAGFHDAWQQDVLEPSFHFIPEMGQESDRVDDAQ